jgi:hypothetical protein
MLASSVMRLAYLGLAALAACSSGDGAVDATPVVDIDNGSCGDQLRFTGELLDWDSSDASFCGVNDADFATAAGMDGTSPNGRFDMCIPRDAAVTEVLVTAPAAAASQCATATPPFTINGIAVAKKAVILAGGFWSGRMFSMARQQTFFQAVGIAFDAGKAQVIVHVDGTPRAVALVATHGPTQAFSGTAWAPGETGREVFFPNVDVAPGGGSTALSVVGGAIGTGSIPLAPGKLTMVSVLAH